MNLALAIVVIAMLVYVALLRLSSTEMRRMADYLNSRADAEDYQKLRFLLYRKQREERESQYDNTSRIDQPRTHRPVAAS